MSSLSKRVWTPEIDAGFSREVMKPWDVKEGMKKWQGNRYSSQFIYGTGNNNVLISQDFEDGVWKVI